MATQETAQPDEFLIQSMPPEIILLILGWCESTRDVLALVSTCRHVYDVWRVNPAAAIWPVYLYKLPYLQDAIIAVSPMNLTYEATPERELRRY
jgi:hypothetical protein